MKTDEAMMALCEAMRTDHGGGVDRVDLDVARLIAGIGGMRSSASAGDAALVMRAIGYLRKSCLPRAYVDGLQDEMLQMLDRADTEHVYLMFHGEADRASYLKIGVSRNVRKRQSSISTGNPLPELWTYTTNLPSRRDAVSLERALLDHMGADRVKGEWVRVGGLSALASQSVADSLAEVASAHMGRKITFARYEVMA